MKCRAGVTTISGVGYCGGISPPSAPPFPTHRLPLLIRALPALLAFAPLPLTAQAAAAERAPPRIPAISVLPPGSVLQGVMLPRYDENRRLVGVLRAKSMTLIDENRIEGNEVSLEFHQPERGTSGRIDLVTAHLDQHSGHVTSTGTVALRSPRLHATGEGLIYAHHGGQAFLAGATTTRIKPEPVTAMNPSSPLRAAALLGVSLVAAPAQTPPAPISAEREAAILADAAPAERVAGDHAGLQRDLEASAAASRAMATFLEDAAKAGAHPVEAADPPKLHVAPDAPLPAAHGPEDIVITSTHGMFFDPGNSVFVYLGDVKVTSPQLTLSGANELKIFLNRADDDSEDGDEGDGGALAGLGDVNRIVATGAVRIKATPEDGEAVEAAGAIFSYTVATEEIILRGGYPWISRAKQGNFRAQEPDLTLRVDLKSGEVVTQGHWETGLELKNLQDRKNR